MKILTGKIIPCKNCGKEVYRRPSLLKRTKFSSCSKSCSMVINNIGRTPWNKGLKGVQTAWNKGISNPSILLDKHPSWKGGRNLMNTGYIRLRTKNKDYQLEHRIVMEDKLGKKLLPNEVVHHIDFNKSNNSIENLLVFESQSAHAKYHQQLKRQYV